MSQASTSENTGLMSKALKEALFAGAMALGLFLLYVGIETYQNINNQLVWRTPVGIAGDLRGRCRGQPVHRRCLREAAP
jgi:branched-chain amino acid transport system permease protein